MEEKRKVTLNLTQEQYTILSAFVNFNQWDFDSMVVENGWEISENLQAESVNEFTADTSDTHEGQHEEIVPLQMDREPEPRTTTGRAVRAGA